MEAYSSAANTAKRLRDLDNLTISNNRRSDSVKSPPRLTTLTTTAVTKPAFSTSKSPRRSESRSPPVFPRQRAGETNQVSFGNEANLSSSGNDDASSLSAKGAFDRFFVFDNSLFTCFLSFLVFKSHLHNSCLGQLLTARHEFSGSGGGDSRKTCCYGHQHLQNY